VFARGLHRTPQTFDVSFMALLLLLLLPLVLSVLFLSVVVLLL
jgi:hypothetical protein